MFRGGASIWGRGPFRCRACVGSWRSFRCGSGSLIFTAIITPTDATPPITYTWTPAQLPLTDLRPPEQAIYFWHTPGTYTLTITAENCGTRVNGAHVIQIRYAIYLPLVLRNH